MKKSPARNFLLKKAPSKLLERINSSIDVDVRLFQEDIEASSVHCKMLIKTKIISPKDGNKIISGLNQILRNVKKGKIKLDLKFEDIHMNVEALLHKKIGRIAGKLHTGRSRNDQVVTDFKLWIKKHSQIIDDEIKKLQKALIRIAKRNTSTVMPGYTHLQIAQPVSLAHHCLAYVEMMGRNRSRIGDCIKRLNESPLGAGALAGTSFPIDRKMTARLLGFSKPTINSIDSVSDRDFAIEFIFSLSLVSIHLSRLAEEIILWSSQHFNFVKLPDELSTGSSIMPQKKNPDGAELVRSNASNIISNLNNILSLLKGLPLAYSKDLQDDKELVFDSYDTLKDTLSVSIELITNLNTKKNNMKNMAQKGYTTATDFADYLVKKKNLPFREAYSISSKLVNYAEKKGIRLDQLSLNKINKFIKKFRMDSTKIFDVVSSMNSKISFGGTAPKNIKKMITKYKRELNE